MTSRPTSEPLASLEAAVRDLESRPAAVADAEVDREVAKQTAAMGRLLARRPRSVHEIRESLARREVDESIADAVIDRLTATDLLDDAAFARAWVDSRRRTKQLGRTALEAELRARGVAPRQIDAALAPLTADDEEASARRLARERLRRDRDTLRRSRGGVPQARIARRLDAFLRRKGYAPSLCLRVVRSEIRAAGGR